MRRKQTREKLGTEHSRQKKEYLKDGEEVGVFKIRKKNGA